MDVSVLIFFNLVLICVRKNSFKINDSKIVCFVVM